jgi:hypothetical protein
MDGKPKAPKAQRRPGALPNKHYIEIAKCIHAWAALEFSVDKMIWELLDTPQPIGACVTGQLSSVVPKLNALTSLSNLYGAAASVGSLKKFAGEIGGLNDQRNRLVHDARFISKPDKKVHRFQISAKNTLKFGMREEKLGELLEFQESAAERTKRFDVICDSLRREIFASRDKLPTLPASIHEPRPARGGRASYGK